MYLSYSMNGHFCQTFNMFWDYLIRTARIRIITATLSKGLSPLSLSEPLRSFSFVWFCICHEDVVFRDHLSTDSESGFSGSPAQFCAYYSLNGAKIRSIRSEKSVDSFAGVQHLSDQYIVRVFRGFLPSPQGRDLGRAFSY